MNNEGAETAAAAATTTAAAAAPWRKAWGPPGEGVICWPANYSRKKSKKPLVGQVGLRGLREELPRPSPPSASAAAVGSLFGRVHALLEEGRHWQEARRLRSPHAFRNCAFWPLKSRGNGERGESVWSTHTGGAKCSRNYSKSLKNTSVFFWSFLKNLNFPAKSFQKGGFFLNQTPLGGSTIYD